MVDFKDKKKKRKENIRVKNCLKKKINKLMNAMMIGELIFRIVFSKFSCIWWSKFITNCLRKQNRFSAGTFSFDNIEVLTDDLFL